MRQLQMLGVVTVCACVSVSSACRNDSRGSLSSPTSIESRNDSGRMYVRGTITDAARQPLAGTTVELLQGARAAAPTAITRSDGTFELAAPPGDTEGDVTLRASREGFVPRTFTTFWSTYPVWIWLDTGPAVALEPGAYTLTISFNPATARPWPTPNAPACAGFPAALSSRTYPVTVTPVDWTPTSDDRLVTVQNAPFQFGNGFVLSIVGRYITIEEMEDWLIEELPAIRFVGISLGQPDGPPSTPALATGSSTSAHVVAGCQYCQLKYPLGHYHDCSQVPGDGVVAYQLCFSEDATMTFARR